MTAPGSAAVRVDAHVHVWSRERQPQPWVDPATMPALARDFDAALDVPDLLAATGSDVAVLVQTLNEIPETLELLDAADLPHVAAVTGWVDLAGDTEDDLARLLAHRNGSSLRAVRHLAHVEPDRRWLGRDDVARGIEAVSSRGLAVELVVRHEQLPLVADVVARHPGTRFVLDHLGKPDVRSGALEPWRSDLARLAAHPQVVAKVSGLALEADHEAWRPADMRPYLDIAAEVFGTARLMYGSDYPLVRLCGGEVRWYECVSGWAQTIAPQERSDLFGGTARRTYGW